MTEWLSGLITSAGPNAPLYYLLGFVLAALLPFIPTPLIGALGGTAFGFGPAVGYGVVGLGLGAFIALTLSRRIGRPILLKFVRPETWKSWEEFLGIRSVFVWGLIFFVLNMDYAVVAAGLTGLPLPQLWLAAMIARLPWLLASAWFGETFLQNDRLLFLGFLIVALLFIGFNKLRPRIQRWLVRFAQRWEARPKR